MSGNSNLPSIGFVSHLDTSSNACGKDVKPRLTRNYDGNDIILENNVVISSKKYIDLKNHNLFFWC